MAKTKYVYYFGDGDAEGDESMRLILGGKGANLAHLSQQKYRSTSQSLKSLWAKSSVTKRIHSLFQFAQVQLNLCQV